MPGIAPEGSVTVFVQEESFFPCQGHDGLSLTCVLVTLGHTLSPSLQPRVSSVPPRALSSSQASGLVPMRTSGSYPISHGCLSCMQTKVCVGSQ